MKFDFSKYKGKYVMHCKTKEEANDFCRVMHEDGRKWKNGDDYTKNRFVIGGRFYYFNEGMRCILEKPESGYTILNWENFMEKEFTKADLKDGMVGITRDGSKFIFLRGKFRNGNGETFLGESENLTEDFKSERHHFTELDFMQICVSSAEILDEWFDDEYLTPVWTRPEEITEMTISEIKTALGIAGTLKIKEDKQ